MKTTHFLDNNYDTYLTFVSLKRQFSGAFFFQVNEPSGPKLTVIGIKPSRVLRAKDFGESFLDVLEQILKENNRHSTFPYENGGVFGCLGHEIVKLIEPKLNQSGYLKDSDVEAEVFVVKNLIIFEHAKNLVHFVLDDLVLDESILKSKGPSHTIPNLPADYGTLKTHFGKSSFIDRVRKIQGHIKEGDIFQAVLSERFERPIQSSPLQIFDKVRSLGPGAYSFFFDLKDSAFFGSSPESLLKVNNGKLETHPIAGTKPRGNDSRVDALLENDLRTCPKEAAEHLMLVDLSRNDLGRVSVPGTITVPHFRSLLKLPNVMHLVSVVQGTKLAGLSALGAFRSCFPAGTLSGAPKVRALEILSEVETRTRGFYGGAVVAFDFNGDLESCIAIRAVEVKRGVAILRAGAGIVQDSIPEKEYEETQHKIKNLLVAIEASEQEELSLQKEMA